MHQGSGKETVGEGLAAAGAAAEGCQSQDDLKSNAGEDFVDDGNATVGDYRQQRRETRQYEQWAIASIELTTIFSPYATALLPGFTRNPATYPLY